LIPVGFGYGDGDEFFYRDGYGIAKLVPAPLPSLLDSHGKIFISKDVVFYEHTFPFST